MNFNANVRLLGLFSKNYLFLGMMRPVRSPLERRRLSCLLPAAKQWIAVTNLNNGVSRVFVRRFVDLDTVYCLCSYDGAFSGTRSKTFYNGKEKVLGRDVEILEKVWRLFSFLLTLQLFSCRSPAFGWN